MQINNICIIITYQDNLLIYSDI